MVSPSNAKLQYSSNRLVLRRKQTTDFKVFAPVTGRLRCVVTVFAFGLGIYSTPSMCLQTINSEYHHRVVTATDEPQTQEMTEAGFLTVNPSLTLSTVQ